MNTRTMKTWRWVAVAVGVTLGGGEALAVMPVPPAGQQSPVAVEWGATLKKEFFKDQEVKEDKEVIDLETPYRAEDAALTPIAIHARIPQQPGRYIKTLYLIVDKNPQPLAAVFQLTPEMGRADLSLRIRINQYTYVRAIAVLNNGEHHMVANFVKAQGGCSAPLGSDLDRAMARIGQMRFRILEEVGDKDLLAGQLQVSHPNITGLQMDQRTRTIHPPHFVKSLKVSYNGKPLLTAELGIAISEDPSFRFLFHPSGQGGKLEAEVVDSKGQRWAKSFEVK
jgi:sulfur-oxidizing protein SoxY